ncbi:MULTISPECIES: helix-turn-helix transcriptional regulator [unclassified Okeania]|uniref:ArsR/SmtB family transcription factor n=1 Tax=unclassified Okeania TaxID=2634635 RepID=UPI0013B5C03E|nr:MULTISPECIES: metalloregulator ArsR/SmtB family transcription factor [unclassified Okeania]NEP38164.1 winged helix-turn-helix transcriptional regulator [Okeania sp. SIO2H7]NET12827.1 winged helix-turn-helix transcriptional regulator [Okeania sp. SIO1H6]NEP74332.1 winged helix-turn-helix transcriptional regulator [Okeania sp. SIO2G5]NEP90586.1 winged helix-turn-helix transcriptional regulator [Okeania sp. SIO2C2]NEP95408.1 winged helix-turn-helix transcriptional regulator [Okeania sp. SIO2F5
MLETSLNLSPTSMAASFQALSDPLRIKILELLRTQELCVCDICDRLQVSQSKLSFHLKNLKEAALVKSRQDGRWIYYSLNLSQLESLEKYLSEYQKISPLPAHLCVNND